MKSYYQNVDYIVRKCLTLSVKDRLNLIYRISLGLCFLMSKNILHRDFKPHNIVVNPSLTPHIIDFGSCCPSLGFSSFVPFDKRCKIVLIYSINIKAHSHLLPLTARIISLYLLKTNQVAILAASFVRYL
jgi:serine/threonine protein kinase